MIDPLEILDKSCGRDIKSYLKCFGDSDHMSAQSSKRLLDFIMRNGNVVKHINYMF